MKSLYEECSELINHLLVSRKLYTIQPYRCLAQFYFVRSTTLQAGIITSSSETINGPINRTWGIFFLEEDKPIRCTSIHSSFYTSTSALNKLLKELNSLK